MKSITKMKQLPESITECLILIRKLESENKNLREALKGFTEAGYPIADHKFQVLLNQAKKLI